MSDPLPPIIAELVERFEANREAYKSGRYNETQVRREFIDPFFEALGWDVSNRHGYAEAYKDVVHEDSLKIGATTKAPDYSFRIGGVRKFFVEAKKPAVNIKEDVAPAYQLRRYAWSAKLPVSILTDFEEFAVFDCRQRPTAQDRASTGRLFYCEFTEYAAKWGEIASIFARESILKGSFDRYALGAKQRKGTEGVDDAFLVEIERWREVLAKNLALRNPELTVDDLNFAVQRTIDRIIFLRICEDRGIEQYGQLQRIAEGSNSYGKLLTLFRRADAKYNSGLFHFAREKGREELPDALTPTLNVDDAVLQGVLGNLYYPASPYEFSVLPPDILGHVYEKFLGSVIRLTSGHHAKIEIKPEVRKSGGVYYTPQYVVEYIVRRTLGRLLEGATPHQASAITVLDPACGSGSFLLGAYDYLLRWHREWYVADGPEKHAKASKKAKAALFRGQRGDWLLSTAKRKEILCNSIFGVDLDAQAVEVTKLSLLLKVLEGENEEQVAKTLKLFEERALPDLGRNIQCGNSLISPDYAFDDDGTRPFDWRTRFHEVFARGGFDCVIGNPPYLSYGGRQIVEIPEAQANYLRTHYECAGWATAHSFFMERATKQLARRFVSFIVPDQVGHLEGYRSLRGVLLNQAALAEVKYWGEHVFEGVITPALTFVLDKAERADSTTVYDAKDAAMSAAIVGDTAWVAVSSRKLLDKLAAKAISVRPYIADCGVRTTDAKQQVVKIDAARAHNVIPTLEGKQIGRYWCRPPEVAVRLDEGDVFKSKVEKYTDAKFLIRQTAAYPIVGPHEHTTYFRNSLHALYAPTEGVDVRYLVGMLNSKAIRFAYTKLVREAGQKAFPQVKLGPLGQLPIRALDLAKPDEREAHDRLVDLVDKMLSAAREATHEANPVKADRASQRVQQLDAAIDRLVFDLFELSDSERVEIEEWVSTLAQPP